MSALLAWGSNLIVAWQSATPWLAGPMKFLTFLGNEEFFLLLLPVLYWSVNRGLGLRVGVMLLISSGVNGFFKLAIHGPRPYWLDARVQALSAETSFGLPSGHAQNALAVWGTVAAWVRERWAWIAALLLAFLIAVSRIFLGVHFPTDTLGGWLLGGLLLWAYLALGPRIAAWWNALSPGGQGVSAFAASLIILALALLGLGLTGVFSLPLEWVANAGAAAPPDPGEAAIDPWSVAGMIANAGALFGLGLGWALLNAQGLRFDAGGVWWKRLVRFLVGLVGTAILWYGLRMVFPRGEDLFSQSLRYLRYALTTLWIIYAAPWVFLQLKLVEPEGGGPTRSG